MPHIAAFDIGKKNFAFAIEYITEEEIQELKNSEKETIKKGKKREKEV